MALLVGAVGTLGFHYLMAAFERQRVRDTFSRFVPAEVVDQLLAEGDGHVRLGGVRRECTMMLTDIRGFTTYAEAKPADEVVEVLNRYLGEMVDAVMDNGGTLVSYLGDGIIADFGAPSSSPTTPTARSPAPADARGKAPPLQRLDGRERPRRGLPDRHRAP